MNLVLSFAGTRLCPQQIPLLIEVKPRKLLFQTQEKYCDLYLPVYLKLYSFICPSLSIRSHPQSLVCYFSITSGNWKQLKNDIWRIRCSCWWVNVFCLRGLPLRLHPIVLQLWLQFSPFKKKTSRFIPIWYHRRRVRVGWCSVLTLFPIWLFWLVVFVNVAAVAAVIAGFTGAHRYILYLYYTGLISLADFHFILPVVRFLVRHLFFSTVTKWPQARVFSGIFRQTSCQPLSDFNSWRHYIQRDRAPYKRTFPWSGGCPWSIWFILRAQILRQLLVIIPCLTG